MNINHGHAGAWNSKGVALSGLGRFEEALESFNMALELDPKNAKAWINKAFALEELGRPKEALAAINIALELNPDDADAIKYKDELMKQLEGNG